MEIKVGQLALGLVNGMPDRFFVVYNELVEMHPEMGFQEATDKAWAILAKEGIKRVDPLSALL